jgi:hypothetical protein
MLALIAFLGGLGLMGWALTSWAPARQLVLGEAEPQATPATRVTPQPLPSTAETARLEARLQSLEAQLARTPESGPSAGPSSRAEALLTAFAARRAVDRGLALGYLEASLQQHFGLSQPRAVGMVIAAARRPITIDQLKDGLIALGPKLVTSPADVGVVDRIRDSLSSLIIVRQAGRPSTLPADRLMRAQRLLDGGRVDLALIEVARLPGAARANEWMRDARQMVETHRALDLLEAAAIMQPGATGKAAIDTNSTPVKPNDAPRPVVPESI